MKKLAHILIAILFLLTSCQENKSSFVYDPTIPYPVLNPGDFWLDKFDQRGLQNAVLYFDRIYCNTIDIGGYNKFLYCLNPTDGLVEWRAKIGDFASSPINVYKGKVIYCSYLGEISTFDTTGKEIWIAKFQHPYGGHWVDTINSQLLVTTVAWNGVDIYDINSGKLISKIENDSIHQLVKNKSENAFPIQMKEYQLKRTNKIYKIKVESSTQTDCKIGIEISN